MEVLVKRMLSDEGRNMKKVIACVFGLLLITGCSGANSEASSDSSTVQNADAIRMSSYYESAQDVYDSLSAANISTMCGMDGENIDGAYAVIEIGLKFDLGVDLESNSEKWDEAIKLLVADKC